MILETDASDYILAAILSTWSNSEICPIAFHSRAFSAAEINYDMHDKELLAIIEFFYHKWSLTICDGYFDTLKSSKMQS